GHLTGLLQHPYREDTGVRRYPGERVHGVVAAGDDAGDDRAVSGLVAVAGPGRQPEVDAVEDPVAQYRVRGGDAGVDHRHNHALTPAHLPIRQHVQVPLRHVDPVRRYSPGRDATLLTPSCLYDQDWTQ